ncbi:MAG: hypothetical protein JNN17_24210 [Verrucomicrobiaceae bacterium]|nr:hypothetical protein [Verrucomicrobiaceae bacterium]
MPDPSQFRHYQIVQDADGNNVELVRNAEQVAVLAFDTQRLEYVHCHVLLEPLANRGAFEDTCRKIQRGGHPAMARMIEYGEDEGNPFYITSNIDGEPLRTYLTRLTDLPCWLAVMLACRSLETAVAVAERGDFLTDQPLENFRVVQTGPQAVQVLAADFRVLDNGSAKKRALKSGFEKQAKFLKTFLLEQAGGNVTLPDHPVPAPEFMELLGACLSNAGPGVTVAMRDLKNQLLKLSPEHLSGEIPTAQKPRALLAPLLASYQDVARGVVNLVRIQSQRLDMANPYSMRGTLTKAGRGVLIEQVPPARVCAAQVLSADQAALKVTKKRENTALITVALVNEADGITCLAEEVAEGISLADLLKERRSIEVQEAYLVLAGLDTALSQLDASNLPIAKLRLEDIFLLTGFPREDARCAKLLVSKLNEWPAFNLVVRAHPTLVSMAGRGTDPAVLLPQVAVKSDTLWHGGWLAALTKLLIGIESPVGVQAEPAGTARERETIARLLDDEIAKVFDTKPSTRSDFLGRYARVVQHHDLVKPTTEPPVTADVDRIQPKPRTKAVSSPKNGTKSVSAPLNRDVTPPVVAGALTSGSITTSAETNAIGFAELLFRSGGGEPEPPAGSPDWAKAAADAPPTLPEHLLPADEVPKWLKVFVFVGGSMILGAFSAHLSGRALWQKKHSEPPKAVQKASQAPSPLKAIPVPELENVPLTPPAETPNQSSGMSLSLPKGATGLREQLGAEPAK